MAWLLTLVEEAPLPKPLHSVPSEAFVKRAPLSLAKAVNLLQVVLPIQFRTEPHRASRDQTTPEALVVGVRRPQVSGHVDPDDTMAVRTSGVVHALPPL